MTKQIFWALALMMTAGTAPALSAPPSTPPDVIRGTITALDGNSLALTVRDGSKVTVTLSPTVKVTEILPSSLAEVKPGSYIGTAAVKEPSGQYRAMELQVFPEKMRGIGLGTRPWSLTTGSSMTNGTVGSMAQTNGTVGSVAANGDMTLTVNDGTGLKTVLVPSTVPVVTYAPGSLAELKPGANVILFAQKDAAGNLTTGRVQVGKDGLTPPM